MRLLVVGAGSTGGYFGGRLAQAGRDVTFLVRQGRAEHLRAKGLQIISPHGDFTLTPKIVTAETLAGPFDAILLTVKAYSIEPALRDLGTGVGADTMILPVLNGMKHVDILTERFGARAVVGCVCKIAATIDDDAIEVLDHFAFWMSAGLANLTNAFDPSRFVIGGGLSAAAPVFEPLLRKHVAARVYASNLRAQPDIRFAELGEQAGAIGAALYGAQP